MAAFKDPCHKEGEQKGPTFVNTYDELIEKTVPKECKFSLVAGSTLLHAVLGKHCGMLLQTGEPFFEDAVLFVPPRGFGLTLDMRTPLCN